MNPETWRNRAACDGSDPELWYVRDGDHERRATAVRICNRCPVREECLAAGMSEYYGIWGGLTARQRRQIRRNRNKYPSLGVERRLRALLCAGWSCSDIVVAIRNTSGISLAVSNLRRLSAGGVNYVHVDTAAAISVAYADLVERTAPSSRRADIRQAKALADGWAPPEAWVGLDIDDPYVIPRSKRAAA